MPGMAAPGAGGRAGGVAVHRLLAGQPGGPPAGPWATDNALRPSASDGVAPDVRQLEVLLAGEPRALAGGAVVTWLFFEPAIRFLSLFVAF